MSQTQPPTPPDSATVRAGRGSFEHYRQIEQILDAVGVAVVACSEGGQIIFVNKEAEFLLGYPRGELVGQAVETLVPEILRGIHPSHRAKYIHEPRTRPMGEGLDLRARRKDGSLVAVEIALGSFMGADGVVTTATILRKEEATGA